MEIELYKKGMSLPDISKQLGIPQSTLRFRLKKIGILRSRAESVRLAALQGKLSSNKGVKRHFTTQWKENISKGLLKWSEINAKKTRINRNGYVEYTTGKNVNRAVHVVLMEERIGRKLYHNECVHHKNHIKTDNSIDNLELMTKQAHSRLHAMEKITKLSRNQKGQFIKNIYEC
jgi:hypothetical protein